MVSALILVVAMVFQIVPNQIFADIGSGANPSEGYGYEESIASPAVFVEGEMPDLRSEDGKHFKLSDGSFISVSYGSSVHYLDSEGKWQDIDNSLFSVRSQEDSNRKIIYRNYIGNTSDINKRD